MNQGQKGLALIGGLIVFVLLSASFWASDNVSVAGALFIQAFLVAGLFAFLGKLVGGED